MTSNKIIAFIKKNPIWLVLVALVIIFSIASPTFLKGENIINLFTTQSIQGILTVGVMFCILSKGIDLSLGSTVAMSAVISASLSQQMIQNKLLINLPTMPAYVAILAGLIIGLIIGFINGWLIAYTKIPAFIATLGMQLIVRALAQLYTNAYPVSQLNESFRTFATGFLIPVIPNIVLVFLIVLVLGGLLLTQTRFGKSVYAIGGNEVAAKVAGIKVEKILVLVYILSGVCAALGGVLLAARTGSGSSTQGLNYELDAIAAATIGGTSQSGGICRISGVIAGILILGVISNGLLLLGVSPYIQDIVKGMIIIGAVVFDMRKYTKKV